MGKKSKKKTAKKTASVEAPPADEPDPTENDAEPEDDAEPETPDPFAEAAEDEGDPEQADQAEAPAEGDDEDKDAEEEKPAAPPDRPTVTLVEKLASKRGEKPDKGNAEKGSIVDWLATVQYTADDIDGVVYYEKAGVSVLTMSDGKKFDVTD